MYAAEVKSTSTVTPAHATSLRRFRELTGAAPTSVLFADIDRALAVSPGVVARPWWALA